MEVYDRLDFETEKKMTYSKIMKPLIFFCKPNESIWKQ